MCARPITRSQKSNAKLPQWISFPRNDSIGAGIWVRSEWVWLRIPRVRWREEKHFSWKGGTGEHAASQTLRRDEACWSITFPGRSLLFSFIRSWIREMWLYFRNGGSIRLRWFLSHQSSERSTIQQCDCRTTWNMQNGSDWPPIRFVRSDFVYS